MEEPWERIKEVLQLVVFIKGLQCPPKRFGVARGVSNCLGFEGFAHAMLDVGPAIVSVPPAEPKPD